LKDSSKNSNEVVVGLHVESVHPVEKVEGSVRSECKQVVARDGLRLSRFRHHEELGQNSHSCQVDTPCPKNLDRSELVIDDEGQEGDGNEEKLNSKGVVIRVISGLELEINQVDRQVGGADKEDFHGRVVKTHVVGD